MRREERIRRAVSRHYFGHDGWVHGGPHCFCDPCKEYRRRIEAERIAMAAAAVLIFAAEAACLVLDWMRSRR